MKVAVVGSCRKNRPLLKIKAEFQEACKAIGKKLAEKGHILIVPHPDNDETAEGYALAGFREIQKDQYYPCMGHEGDLDLKAHFDAVDKSDAVILIGGQSGTYASGLVALRRRKLVIPIPAFGGSAKDLCNIPEIDNMLVNPIRNLEVGKNGWINDLTNAINSVLSAFPRVLIIHGRGDSGKALKEKIKEKSTDLNSRLNGIAEPLIMDLSGKGAVSVPDVFEDSASKVSAAIAIITADDIGGFARRSEGTEYSATELKLEPRARENVWVEVGWFWGRLGRQRVFLWLKNKIRLPSDLEGAAWTQKESIDDAWNSVEAFIFNLRNST